MFRMTRTRRMEYLACWRCDHKVGVHVLLAELFGNVETQRAVIVVDVSLGDVAQDRVGPVDFLELNRIQYLVRNIQFRLHIIQKIAIHAMSIHYKNTQQTNTNTTQ